MIQLRECVRLRASITERQCEINRNGHQSRGLRIPPITTCAGCAGLGASVRIPAVQEEAVAKRGTCKVCGKTDTQIIGAGMCYSCRKEAIEAGTYPEPADIVGKGTDKAEQQDAPGGGQDITAEAIGRGEVATGAARAAEPTGEEILHLPNGSIDLLTAPRPLPTALQRLLKPALVLPPTAIVLLFTEEEHQAILEEKVTPEDIRQLVLHLIGGDLQMVAG